MTIRHSETMVSLNGELGTLDSARIAPDDRGLLLGDGLFETLRVESGQVAFLDAHLDRMRAGAESLGIPFEHERSSIARTVRSVIEANGLVGTEPPERSLDATGRSGLASVRITLTRGSGPRGLNAPTVPEPTLLVTAGRMADPSTDVGRVVVASERRLAGSIGAKFKTLSYLGNVMARREAQLSGADEALILNERGRICGASAANVFTVIDGTLLTPPLRDGALPGVTRRVVLAAAERCDISCAERSLTIADVIEHASDVFLTNSLVEIQRVETIEGWVRKERAVDPDGEVDRLRQRYIQLRQSSYDSD